MKKFVVVVSYPGTDRKPLIDIVKTKKPLTIFDWAQKAFYHDEEDIENFLQAVAENEIYIECVEV